MTTMKCPCGFDSKYTHSSDSYAVGEVQRKSGLSFIILMDGGSVWVCKACLKIMNDAATKISDILGSTYWTATSVMPRTKEGK